ncbi:hypothetical protein GCM10009120_27160 [Sphingobacterium siyangense subsp. cladoniae]|uniref:GLPGLI family protein n=1 Tax=Sphingobacterium siyangense TaxID=459529 RepID=UPI0031F7D56B
MYYKKNIILNLFLFLTFSFYKTATFAQAGFKVTYVGKVVSSSVSSRISEEVKDIKTRKAFLEMLNEYKIIYNLFLETSTGKSIMVEYKEFPLEGPPPFKEKFSYSNNIDNYSEIYFRGKTFKIKDSKKSLSWKITTIKQKIGSFSCQKAILSDDPFNSVAWFTTDIPLSVGPSFSNGLPGAVVLYENDYFTLTMEDIKKVILPKDIVSKLKNYSDLKGISIQEYFKKTTPILNKMKSEKIIND